jgi:hypothetical protein
MNEFSNEAINTFAGRGLNGQEALVEEIKNRAAGLWDLFNSIPNVPGTPSGRLTALAKTELESSVMWAVKAISRTG